MSLLDLADHETIIHILEYLPPISLADVGGVSRRLYFISNKEKIWEYLCKKEWDHIINVQQWKYSRPILSWKTCYPLLKKQVDNLFQIPKYFTYTRQQAEQLINSNPHKQAGDYLIRTSSVVGCYAITNVSHVFKTNHMLIRNLGYAGVFLVSTEDQSAEAQNYQQNVVFPSFASLVKAHSKVFKRNVDVWKGEKQATTLILRSPKSAYGDLRAKLELDIKTATSFVTAALATGKLSATQQDQLHGMHLIQQACKLRTPDLLKQCIQLGVKVHAVDHKGRNGLHYLAKRSDVQIEEPNVEVDMANLLIQHGIDMVRPDLRGFIPPHLFIQSKHQNVALFDILVKAPGSLIVKDKDFGNNTLHWCLLMKRTDIFKKIQTHPEYTTELVNEPQGRGLTPLHIACETIELGIVEQLVNKGASVHARDKWGQTPLHSAVSQKQDWLGLSLIGKPHGTYYSHQVVTFLIQLGAQVTAVDVNGNTPLHLATINGHFQSSRALLLAGADKGPNLQRLPWKITDIDSTSVERVWRELQFKVRYGYAEMSLEALNKSVAIHCQKIINLLQEYKGKISV